MEKRAFRKNETFFFLFKEKVQGRVWQGARLSPVMGKSFDTQKNGNCQNQL
ncbi:hypothetical protein HMPREF3213_03899 [Heyndrickxia coagulans]|uniref:Uncharacterized protein n=1 Tax=Heyndrickxia coagulans TaxID=1398 RepID=A0A0C5C989_HEYCO|nr:hypothetical protein SB48_HM08orf03785 [Heyndrickxia coagulans]KWZ76146.1 hypothetical protein HMPREF3213_03899 [Heyndrickxia coagulans]